MEILFKSKQKIKVHYKGTVNISDDNPRPCLLLMAFFKIVFKRRLVTKRYSKDVSFFAIYL